MKPPPISHDAQGGYGLRVAMDLARETQGMVARDSLVHNGKPSLSGIYAQRLSESYPGLRAFHCPDGHHWHLQADATEPPLDAEEREAVDYMGTEEP